MTCKVASMKYIPSGANCQACAMAMETSTSRVSRNWIGFSVETMPRRIRIALKSPCWGLYMKRNTTAAAYVDTDQGRMTRAERRGLPLKDSLSRSAPPTESKVANSVTKTVYWTVTQTDFNTSGEVRAS